MDKKVFKLVTNIPGWLSTREGEFLAKAASHTRKLKGEIVEIGSFCGKSTIWLAQAGKKVYAIDPHKGKLSHNHKKVSPTLKAFQQNIKQAGVAKMVVPIVKTSAGAAKEWDKRIKMLFIDGLHDEKNARLDFKLWGPHLVNGGLVAMHDSFCGWAGAEKVALEKIVFSDEFYEIGVVDSITYGIKGKGNWLSKINRLHSRTLINLSLKINHQKWLSGLVRFIAIRKLIGPFLILFQKFK